MPYDYERFEELLKHHLDAMYHDSDEGSEIGENISSVEEVKIESPTVEVLKSVESEKGTI